MPKGEPRSALEEAIVAYGESIGIEKGGRRSLVPPMPFVLGDIVAPKVIVLLEGQWDAISFYGACGLFEESTSLSGIAVFGIRGAQGTDAFLGHWAHWLDRVKPRAWLIADNDAAGKTWREPPPAESGMPRPPGLAERLTAAGCRSTLVSWLKPGSWGKDFNDYYRVKKPSAEAMATWLRNVGLLDKKGNWL